MSNSSKLIFDLVSDIHNEFYDSDLDWRPIKNPNVDVLVIAGDTANDVYETKRVIKGAQLHYTHVLYVCGNHDYYQTQRTKLKQNENPYTVSDIVDFYARHSKLEGWTYLPADDCIIGDTVFIGENGWYGFGHPDYSQNIQKNTWQMYMSDSRLIHFDTDLPEVLAEKAANSLSAKIKKYDTSEDIKKIVVVTHTLPRIEALIIKPNDMVWNYLSGSFYNHNMKDVHLLSNKVKVWCFGHTHSQHDFTVDHARFVSNPRGYPMENPYSTWSPKTVSI